MNCPDELLYTKSHEWVRIESDGSVTIGITDYAQAALGDVTFVQLPAAGEQLVAGRTLGVIESVKAASDLYVPLTSRVVVTNRALDQNPSLVNQAPYTDGWLVRLQPAAAAEFGQLLNAAAYRQNLV